MSRNNVKSTKKPAMARELTRDELIVKLVAIFWEQFGRGANLQIAPECFDRAVNLGALDNVRNNLDELSDFDGEAFEAAKFCSFRAGRRARRNAVTHVSGKKDRIDADMYQEAFEWIAEGNDRLIRRNYKNVDIKMVARICA